MRYKEDYDCGLRYKTFIGVCLVCCHVYHTFVRQVWYFSQRWPLVWHVIFATTITVVSQVLAPGALCVHFIYFLKTSKVHLFSEQILWWFWNGRAFSISRNYSILVEKVQKCSGTLCIHIIIIIRVISQVVEPRCSSKVGCDFYKFWETLCSKLNGSLNLWLY